VERKKSVVSTGSKDNKLIIAVHDIENDKKEVRDFYDAEAYEYNAKVRVQQTESPKIVTACTGLEVFDFESGEPIQSYSKNISFYHMDRDPTQPDIFYVASDFTQGVKSYDIRVKEKIAANFSAAFGGSGIDSMTVSSLGSKLIVTSSAKATIFDLKTRKVEFTIEPPRASTYFRNGAQYGNVLALQWAEHVNAGKLLIYDLSNLKGTAPKYEATKTISSASHFECACGGQNLMWQINKEGIFIESHNLYHCAFPS